MDDVAIKGLKRLAVFLEPAMRPLGRRGTVRCIGHKIPENAAPEYFQAACRETSAEPLP